MRTSCEPQNGDHRLAGARDESAHPDIDVVDEPMLGLARTPSA
jgi:hypothetical protein